MLNYVKYGFTDYTCLPDILIHPHKKAWPSHKSFYKCFLEDSTGEADMPHPYLVGPYHFSGQIWFLAAKILSLFLRILSGLWSPLCICTLQAKNARKSIPPLPRAILNQCQMGIGVWMPQLPRPSSRMVLSHVFHAVPGLLKCDWVPVAHCGKLADNILFIHSFPSLTHFPTHMQEFSELFHKWIICTKIHVLGSASGKLNRSHKINKGITSWE